jgi:predicted nucleotide-binding protein (sugar kinase/HSP70/actin superfamily)
MAGKPHLELEIDEHTADAGLMTRCEAFIESLHVRRQLAGSPMPALAYASAGQPLAAQEAV